MRAFFKLKMPLTGSPDLGLYFYIAFRRIRGVVGWLLWGWKKSSVELVSYVELIGTP